MGEVERLHHLAPKTLIAAWECTPLVVKGVLYLSTPSSRVIALEAETGTEIWQFDPEQVTPEKPFYVQHRGVSFWQGEVDGKKQGRILIGTGDARLIALDAETGRPPLARHSLTREEISNVTPEHREFCLELFDSLRYEGIYTPREPIPA